MNLKLRHACLAAALAASLAACATNPVTGKKDLMLVGEGEELSIGQQNYAPMRQSEGGDIGHHVTGIGEQGERSRQQPADDLDEHETAGEDHRP